MLKTLGENHIDLTVTSANKELAHCLSTLPQALQDSTA